MNTTPKQTLILFLSSLLLFSFSKNWASVCPPTDFDDLVINEIAPRGTLLTDDSGKNEDWFELYNTGDEFVTLTGLYLSDNPEDLQKWRIDTEFVLSPGGCALFFADKDPEEGALHTNFKLKSSGETLTLAAYINEDMVVLDAVTYGEVALNTSYGRRTDGAADFVLFGEPTPAGSNDDALLYLPAPTFSVPSGIYTGTQTITLSHDLPDVTIHYRYGGYLPDASSLSYGDPFILSHNTVIRAIAVKEGYVNSPVANSTFLFQADMPNGEMPNMDVLCLTTDPYNFFDDEYGIYVKGTNGTTGFCTPDTANYKQHTREWERPVNIKMLLKEGTLAFDVNAGTQIGGACSRIYPMRGLNLYLRNNYYGDKKIEYPIFPKRDNIKYKRLKLRNSGQDYLRLGFRDALIHNALMGKIDLEFLAARSVLAYINDEFWGVYNLREFYAGEYFETLFDVKEDQIDVIKNPGMDWETVKMGSSDDFHELLDFAENNDLSDAVNYNYVDTRLDINNFLNLWASEIYLANVDWPANNNYIWRNREDGNKWRYLFQDLDGSTNGKLVGFGDTDYNSLACATTDVVDSEQPQCNPEATILFRKLLDNQSFKDEYIQRTCSFIQLLFDSTYFVEQIDSMQNLFEPNFAAQIDRWKDIGEETGFPIWGGGSIWAWYAWIDKFKEFFQDRPDIMRTHIREEFGLDDTFLLHFATTENTHGKVLINHNEMVVPSSYSGIYFKNIPIRIRAVPEEGYKFVKWMETGDTNPSIDFVATADATLTPVFEESSGIEERTTTDLLISPNPANNVIYFSLPATDRNTKAKVINAIGQTVMEITLSDLTGDHTEKINIKGLQTGVYTLMITSGHTRKTGRFIVR